ANTSILSRVKLLVPVIPPTFYAAGVNYREHVTEMAHRRGVKPEFPPNADVGYRANNALVATDEPIVIPKDATDQVQYEGELVAVIGKRCKKVSEAEALDYVFGYTLGNDVSERTWQRGDRTFWRGKNTDTFKPMGPWIVTGLNPDTLRVTIRLNGKEMFTYAVKDAIFGVRQFISRMSQYLTLYPGDVLWRGPAGATENLQDDDALADLRRRQPAPGRLRAARRRGALPPRRGPHPYDARGADLPASAGARRSRGAAPRALRPVLLDPGPPADRARAALRLCAPSRRPHREPAADEGPSGDHRHASRHDLCPRGRGDRGYHLHAPRLRGARERLRLGAVTRLFLIRHGETEGNALRIVQHPHIPLSPRGIVQAERLALRLAGEGIAQIVSSDYARAMTTAEHLQRATGAPLVIEPLLRERNFGDLRGTPYAELGFDMFALEYAPPNGETWPMFHERVDRAWE